MPRPSASTAHRWVVSPSDSVAAPDRGAPWDGLEDAARCGSTAAARAPSRSSDNSAAPSAPSWRTDGAIEAGDPARLGHHVRPERIGGIRGEPDLFGDPGGAEREIALGRRRDRPQVVAERPQRERFGPLRQRSRQIVRRVLPVAQLEEGLGRTPRRRRRRARPMPGPEGCAPRPADGRAAFSRSGPRGHSCDAPGTPATR